MFSRATAFVLSLPTLICPLYALDLYVSAQGKVGNSGEKSAPLADLAAARDVARKVAGKEAVTVHVADGIYYLPETLAFSPEDSGSEKFPITYQAVHEGKAVISGGACLSLKWQVQADGQYVAETPAGLAIDQLFIDGVRQRMARYPNFDATKTTAAYQGYAADAFSKERAARWKDPVGGFIHAMHVGRWGGYHYRITGKDAQGNVTYEGGWQNNRQMGMHAEFRMVENIREELDAAGEWFHDAKENELYYKPEAAVNLAESVVEVVRLPHLIEFRGSEKSPVRFITLKGFTYRHTARTFMECKEPLLRSDWAIYRGAAILLTGTEHVSLLDSEFDQVGGNAVFFNYYNRSGLVKGCHIHNAGASGVCFVGDSKAVRNPLFEYAQSQDLTKIDRTPGPIGQNFPADCVVDDCLIHGIGRIERQPAAVQISMAQSITVSDVSIYDCARAGINISEGTWGGHLIEGCDVFDTVLETHDHGSFNSWGRDRFWTSNHRGVSMPEVQKDPKLPYLDCVKTTIIRNSRWRCDHGWDIDLDDGSSNYEIYNNLLLQGGLKFREGYGRNAYNNIIINNGFHPHVWFDDSASKLTQNILMKAHAPIGQPEQWGREVDRNFFTNAQDLPSHRAAGADQNSLAGDAEFIDPAQGDFRVKDSSAALKIGFKNFPMDQFGVKKPSLKSIAKTPVIPALLADDQPVADAVESPRYWLGARLHSLEGEEFSAFGTRKEDGGVHLVQVPDSSAAKRAGLQKDDLIQELNGHIIRHVTDLLAALTKIANAPLQMKLIRFQKPLALAVKNAPYTVIESAPEGTFTRIKLAPASALAVTSSRQTNNDPLSTLVDGKVAANYGPVFGNGVMHGMYKIDIGSVKSVKSIRTWSHHLSEVRGHQLFNLYGSSTASDPGWNVQDDKTFTALASIDTLSATVDGYVATSLEARSDDSLGKFRWIIWSLSPISPAQENTAQQELQVIVE
ncbi:MAG TPA: signaling protein [Verrucomicrobiales bacterium]|nr:MAG: signaling protein [Verrucomicrobiae bacterium Tous-C3TDCM]PAZ03895.1 MAG: signaling protein [Verrucomicrobiae bacterium AMD-G2]HBE22668.1 signaling protein [Verrucomicrobiales bacterium]